MECVDRAQALAGVLQEYALEAQDDMYSRTHVFTVATLIEELLGTAFNLMPDWWAGEADLQRVGWTPPRPGPDGAMERPCAIEEGRP
jgi:hypothetical protein